jgi:hypothetical protein
MKVEALDEDGKPIGSPANVRGDSVAHRVDLGKVQGRALSLQFTMRDADLFAVETM